MYCIHIYIYTHMYCIREISIVNKIFRSFNEFCLFIAYRGAIHLISTTFVSINYFLILVKKEKERRVMTTGLKTMEFLRLGRRVRRRLNARSGE